jgi:hypothetical protein
MERTSFQRKTIKEFVARMSTFPIKGRLPRCFLRATSLAEKKGQKACVRLNKKAIVE